MPDTDKERYLLVDVNDGFMDLAVMENDRLVEYQRYAKEDASILSNIYIGRVSNVVKGMQALFIDIGLEKNAYMKINKGDNYQQGQQLMVQVIKPPYKQKGAVVTQNISIPGKYAVIKPFDKGLYVSSKIRSDEERQRLLSILSKEDHDSGFIVRTQAIGASEEQLNRDITYLEELWDQILKVAEFRTCYSVIYEEPSPLIRTVKDLLNDEVKKFVINDAKQFELVVSFINEYYPEYKDRVFLYEKDDWHLFHLYKVDSQLKKALKKHVWLKSGASIVIEQTEALVSIDVNTAKFTGKKLLDKTILSVNLEACKAIACQLRLRNLSGIIIIDFIDMKDDDHNEQVIRRLKHELKDDRLKTRVLGMTQLGLVEMTRKKISEPLSLQLKEE